MATISCTSFWSRWDAKQYIFAGLVGALVTMAVVAVISISLAPAHIFFSVANATTSNVSAGGNLSNGFYNFTLVSNNTSWHTKSHFATLSAQIWYSTTGYIMAEDVNTTAVLPWWQSPRNVTNIAFCADYGQYDEKPQPGNKSATSSMQLDEEKAIRQDCHVVVMAKVWFKSVYGLLATVPYTIQVTCLHVNFSNTTNVTVKCS